MAVAVSFKIEKGDIATLQKAMQRAQRELNLKQPQAIKMAMTHVLSGLANSTTVSKPYRDYEDKGPAPRSKVGNRIYVVTTKYQTPKRKGKALRRSWQGPFRGQVIYAKNERELKRRPAVIIAMRGVARQSWMEAGKKSKLRLTAREVEGTATAVQARAAKNKRRMRKAARRWVSYEANLKGDNAYIKVTNHMRHISAATSPSALSMVIGRAAQMMENRINGLVRKAIEKRAA
jgi:hypothetical protein